MSGTDFDPGRGDQNHGRPTRWDDWTVDQWLEEAARFDKMALRFRHRPQLNASFKALAQDALVRARDGRLTEIQVVPGTDWRHPQPRHGAARATNSDTEYFCRRAAQEQRAALHSRDLRVRRVHLEMAERYRAVSPNAGTHGAAEFGLGRSDEPDRAKRS
jgi:hypothetical protein